ncbi:hypothetical protein VRRI112168_08240 [Vreelandella rituensis]
MDFIRLASDLIFFLYEANSLANQSTGTVKDRQDPRIRQVPLPGIKALILIKCVF